MGIVTRVDPDLGFAWHVGTGVLEVSDFLAALREIYEHPEYDPEKGGIWDLRGADASSATADDMRVVVEFIRKARGQQSGRTAIVVTRDVEFGLGRMYEAFAESVVPFGVFRDWDEALGWVTGKSEQERPPDW